ncbi:MAG: FliM/FliN family flagellar motor switch protein [Kofleriaceae bacterium]|nr:FliM/FliN family flagellar motor switch protein [Kofleriaceae bacterium]
MSDAPLDSNELEAIQDAVREAQQSVDRPVSPTPYISDDDVLPLALIADDRVAESARPAAMRLADRWAELAAARLKHVLKGDVSIKVVGAEVIDGGALREELEKMWTCGLTLSDRAGCAVVAVGGPMISGVAARLLGAEDEEESDEDEDEEETAPTAASLRIFEPVGITLVETLVMRWEGMDRCTIDIDYSEAGTDIQKRELVETDVVVSVTLSVEGPVKGHIRLLAPPKIMVPPPQPIEAVPAAPGAIETALGQVEVEVSVELGRARLSLTELRQIRVGTILALGQFVDDPLPVQCAGVVKAYGRAVVTRGVLAVEIVRRDSMGQVQSLSIGQNTGRRAKVA